LKVTIIDNHTISVDLFTHTNERINKIIKLPILTRPITHYGYNKDRNSEHYILHIFTSSRHGGNYYRCLITENSNEQPFFNEITYFPIEINGLCALVTNFNDTLFLISGRNDDHQEVITISGENCPFQKTIHCGFQETVLDVTDSNFFHGKRYQDHNFRFDGNGILLEITKKVEKSQSEILDPALPVSSNISELRTDLISSIDLREPLDSLGRLKQINYQKTSTLQATFVIVKV
jgi:hypothetical protein